MHLRKLERENLQIVSVDKRGCLVQAKKATMWGEKKTPKNICLIYIWRCIQSLQTYKVLLTETQNVMQNPAF